MPTLLDPNQIYAGLYGGNTTGQQQANLGGLLQGREFNAGAYLNARPDLARNYNADYEAMYGSLNDYARADWQGNNSPSNFLTGGLLDLASDATRRAGIDQVGANTGLRTGNINDLAALGPQARAAWEAANPQFAQFTGGLLGQLNTLNAGGPGAVPTATANAAQAGIAQAGISQAAINQAAINQAGIAQARANLARYQAANRGQLSGQLEGDASRLLAQDGMLTAGEQRGISENVLGAYGDRGLAGSAGAISALALQSDAARQARRQQNQTYAQNIANLNQGYNLADQSSMQQNRQFNSGLLSSMSQFNAGARNQGMQFNTDAMNRGNQFNASAMNQGNQFNSNEMNRGNQFNASALNQGNQYNAGLLQQANLFNANSANDMGRYNADLARSLQNDSWTRNLSYAGLLGSQAADINGMLGVNSNAGAMGANTINQGLGMQDSNNQLLTSIYNFNANAENAAQIAAGNNAAAQAGARTASTGAIIGGGLAAVGGIGLAIF